MMKFQHEFRYLPVWIHGNRTELPELSTAFPFATPVLRPFPPAAFFAPQAPPVYVAPLTRCEPASQIDHAQTSASAKSALITHLGFLYSAVNHITGKLLRCRELLFNLHEGIHDLFMQTTSGRNSNLGNRGQLSVKFSLPRLWCTQSLPPHPTSQQQR